MGGQFKLCIGGLWSDGHHVFSGMRRRAGVWGAVLVWWHQRFIRVKKRCASALSFACRSRRFHHLSSSRFQARVGFGFRTTPTQKVTGGTRPFAARPAAASVRGVRLSCTVGVWLRLNRGTPCLFHVVPRGAKAFPRRVDAARRLPGPAAGFHVVVPGLWRGRWLTRYDGPRTDPAMKNSDREGL